MLPETLGELLNVSVAVGLIGSLLLEKLQWWNEKTADEKAYYVKWLSVGVGLIITLVNTFLPESMLVDAGTWYEVAQPLLNMLIATIGGVYVSGQATHVLYRAAYKAGNG